MAIGTDFKPSPSNSFYSNFPAYSPKRSKFLGSAGSSFTDGFSIDSSKNISRMKYDFATTAYDSYHSEPEEKGYKIARLGTRKLKRLQNGQTC